MEQELDEILRKVEIKAWVRDRDRALGPKGAYKGGGLVGLVERRTHMHGRVPEANEVESSFAAWTHDRGGSMESVERRAQSIVAHVGSVRSDEDDRPAESRVCRAEGVVEALAERSALLDDARVGKVLLGKTARARRVGQHHVRAAFSRVRERVPKHRTVEVVHERLSQLGDEARLGLTALGRAGENEDDLTRCQDLSRSVLADGRGGRGSWRSRERPRPSFLRLCSFPLRGDGNVLELQRFGRPADA